MMRSVVGRVERMGDHLFFLGRVIVRTACGYLVEANPKCIRDVIAVFGVEDSTATPSVKRTPKTRVSDRTRERETSRVQDSRGKAVVHVPGAC